MCDQTHSQMSIETCLFGIICQKNSPPCNIERNSSYFTLLNPLLFLFFKIPHLQTLKLIKMPKQVKPFTFKVYLFMMNNFKKCKKTRQNSKTL